MSKNFGPGRLSGGPFHEIPDRVHFVSGVGGTERRNHSLPLFLENLITLTIQLSQLRFRHRWQCCLHGGNGLPTVPISTREQTTSSRCVALA